MTYGSEPTGTLIAESGADLTSDEWRGEGADLFDFASKQDCFEWIEKKNTHIARSRIFAFGDGSAYAEVWFNTSVLFQQDKLSASERERRINEIYRRVTNPVTYGVTDAQKALLTRELQMLMQSRGEDAKASTETEVIAEHKHTCATCRREFSHDPEEDCPEIKGRSYCPQCYPKAFEHNHYCPVCARRWSHRDCPDCALGQDAQCERHNAAATHSATGLAAVAGMAKLKNLLYEQVVAPLRDPQRFVKYGLSIPNGILMFGPPGCGKTYVTKRLSEELGYFFSEVSASSVADSYIHGTTAKIAERFAEAEQNAPAILFLDEFESLVPSRSQLAGHQDYRVEEISEFLRQLDSAARRRILVIAATNEPWKIDPAVQRAGRLDKKILIGPPDLNARVEMLRFHLEPRFREPNLQLTTLANAMEGYSASDIRLLVDEAARQAWRSNVPIGMDHLLKARTSVPASVPEKIKAQYESFGQRGA